MISIADNMRVVTQGGKAAMLLRTSRKDYELVSLYSRGGQAAKKQSQSAPSQLIMYRVMDIYITKTCLIVAVHDMTVLVLCYDALG